MLNAQAIHAAIAWPAVLEQLGIDERFLRNRHGPCPVCGGRDRFRFDNLAGRGGWFCNRCGPGDGFKLLQLVHHWTFAEARRRVIDVAGLDGRVREAPRVARSSAPDARTPAAPTGRVNNLLSTATVPADVADVIEYFQGRTLWPLPLGTSLRAHAGAEYWDRGDDGTPFCVGRFPAIVAEVRDVAGDLVTAHVTYLKDGHKLDIDGRSPRKLLGKLTARRGCAARLQPSVGDTLGIAEGIETALAAHVLHRIPVWAALNASLLAKFEPPPSVHRVIVFADRDIAGLEAAIALHEQLDGRATVETRTAPAPAKDWADVLLRKRS